MGNNLKPWQTHLPKYTKNSPHNSVLKEAIKPALNGDTADCVSCAHTCMQISW